MDVYVRAHLLFGGRLISIFLHWSRWRLGMVRVHLHLTIYLLHAPAIKANKIEVLVPFIDSACQNILFQEIILENGCMCQSS